ncbi:MAG: hypothetical protein ABW172_00685, partial [Candidatus Binatia bacterium]
MAVHAQEAGGLKAEIASVSIPVHRRPVVTFKITDSKGKALELADLDKDSLRFTIAAISGGQNGETSLRNYILTRVAGKEYVYKGEIRKPVLADSLQPDFDQGGALARIGPGTFSYSFKFALPSNYNRNATHIVGGELTRGRGKYVANPLYEFVPAGGKIKGQRNLVETATCNNCH